MGEPAISIQEVANREHLSPAKSGDNISAKKVASYNFGSDGNWSRQPLPLVDTPYDYVAMTNPDGNGNYQTFTYKSGGSAGTTVRTLAFTYDGASNVTSITRT